jgi:hypothetical protein
LRGIAVFASLLGMALLASCGGEAPELLALEWRLEERPAKEGNYESLSVFASVRDYEGVDNLESLSVVNDGEKLAWRLSPSNWTRQETGGDVWIGASDLAMADYGKLPKGEYKVIVTDLAGQQKAMSFRIGSAATGGTAPRAMPALRMAGEAVAIDSGWPETLVLAYDGAGSLIGAREAMAGKRELKELFGPSLAARAEFLAAYGYDTEQHRGAYSWRIKTR